MSWLANGGYWGPRPAGPSASEASGWWDSRSQFRYKRDEAWPPSSTDQFFNDVTLLIQDDIVDESLQQLSLTVGGNAAKSNTQVKVGTHSIALNGGSDRISAASGNVLNFGTGPFTVEAWFYITSSNNQMWLEGPSNNGFQFLFQSGVIGVGISGSASSVVYTAPQSFFNNWVHLAAVREGTGTNQSHLYYNGSKVASGTNSHNYTTTGFQISRTGGYLFYGYFDALRVTKAARYVANFTPSTSPYL